MKNPGEQFLHSQNPKLHTETPVEHEYQRKRTDELHKPKEERRAISQKPDDKLASWMQVLERTHLGHDNDPRVLERIRDSYHRTYVIAQEDIPESYYNTQKRLARERGHGDIEITDSMKRELGVNLIADQKSTLNTWFDYFTCNDSNSIPMWAKYWAFTNMLKLSTFDKEKHEFGKRSKDTVAPFPDLNREALAYVIDAIIKKANKESVREEDEEFQKILQGASFSKLYAWAIEKVTPTEARSLLNTKGEWKKYKKGSDHMPLVNSLQGHGTNWCTAGESTAKNQLSNGDFHVYYTYDEHGKPTIPRVAIRMENNSIAEIRGIAKDQNLDPYIGGVVEEKITEFPDGEKYKEKALGMQLLTEIEHKHQTNQDLTKEELRFLYEIDNPIKGFGYQKDPRVAEIIEARGSIKKDIALAIGCSEDEISTTEEEALEMGNKSKYHYGNLDLSSLKNAEGLTLPQRIGGNIDLHSLTNAKGLTLPQSVGKNINLNSLTSAEGLVFPQSVGGYIDLYSLKNANGLTLPQSVGGSLDLSLLTNAEGLVLPQSVGGDLDLYSLKNAKGLTLPQSVGGFLSLGSLTDAEGLVLPQSVGGDLSLRSLKNAEGLVLPQSVGGFLSLGSLTDAEGLVLPQSVGGDLYLGSLTNAEELTLPQRIGGNIDLHSLTNAKGLVLPQSVEGRLDLNSLKNAKGLTLPQSVGGYLSLRSLETIEGLVLPKPENVKTIFIPKTLFESNKEFFEGYRVSFA